MEKAHVLSIRPFLPRTTCLPAGLTLAGTLAALVPGRFLCNWNWNGGIVPSEQRAADALSFPMENPTTSFDLAGANYTCPDYVCVSEEGQAECDADPECSGLPW